MRPVQAQQPFRGDLLENTGSGTRDSLFVRCPCCLTRHHSAEAEELRTCFAISKESFLDALKKMTRKASSEVFQLLLGSELFRYLDSSYVAMLSKCSYSMKYQDRGWAWLLKQDEFSGSLSYVPV